MSAVEFCGICTTAHKHDAYGHCGRHDKPVRGVIMACVHCPAVKDRSQPAASYGDACPECGIACVGELGEPAMTLASGDTWTEYDGCRCRLQRRGDEVRLYRCKLHHEAAKTMQTIDEACSEIGCDSAAEALVAITKMYSKERDKALDALGVDETLGGQELTTAIEHAESNYDPEAQDKAAWTERLLEAVGLTEEDLAGGRDPWLRAHFSPVEFLTARLRELAPERLAPRSPLREVLETVFDTDKPRRKSRRGNKS